MYTTILVALDGSPRSELVLQQGGELARLAAAELHLCRAVNVPLEVPAWAWALTAEELIARLIEEAEGALGALAGRVGGVRIGGVHVRLGRPAQVICEVAETTAADLIVLGSHGFDALDRLLGTTAARVVNLARCSVLVVRPPHA